jgi:hypothetical protein
VTTYSVYNYDTHAYDYYEGRGPGGTHAGTPPMRKATSDLGASPEQVAWLLPAGARKVGTGDLPKGYIASLGGVESEGAPDLIKIGIVAVGAYLLWKAIR